MSFYSEQVYKMTQQLYSKKHLTRQIIDARQYINRHFAEDCKISSLGNKVFISEFHFIRLFKSIYGVTPHQYLISVRISNAKKLLAAGNPISDTCFAVGFKSPTSFTALFKKMTGRTPSQIKMSNFQEAI